MSVNSLLAACQRTGFQITKDELITVVDTNDKKRFSFNNDGLHVRANQGHSIKVDLGYKPFGLLNFYIMEQQRGIPN